MRDRAAAASRRDGRPSAPHGRGRAQDDAAESNEGVLELGPLMRDRMRPDHRTARRAAGTDSIP